MEKVDLLAFSDLIFDFCPSCEGFYFDAREIEAMNKELRKLSEGRTGEEYRAYHDERLVRVDRLWRWSACRFSLPTGNQGPRAVAPAW